MLFLAVGFLARPAKANSARLSREDFVGVGTLDAAAPGNLGAITVGTLYRRAVGPRTAGVAAPGWSAQMRRAPFASTWNLTSPSNSAASGRGCVGAWVRFTSFGGGNYPASHGAEILRLTTTAGALVQAIAVNGDGRLLNADPSGTDGTTSAVLSLHTWYYFSAEWSAVSGSTSALRFSVQPLGGAAISLLNASRNAVVGRAGLYNGSTLGASSLWAGRVGGAGLYSLDTPGVGQQLPADLLPPVEERHVWHLNPATGDDNNDGSAPDRAWRTVAKLNAELTNAGVFGTLTPWAYAATGQPVPASLPKADRLAGLEDDSIVINGDRILVDTSAAPLYVTEEILLGDLPGVLLTGARADVPADLLAFKPLASAGFTPAPGSARVFQTADTEASVCLWEDRKFLNHPAGNAYAGAVATFLENTPGAFWTDGVTLYVHPFGDTDPRTDGKSYERSRLYSGVGANALRFRGGGNCQIDNLRLGGTTLAPNDNVPGGHYCVFTEARDNKVSRCFLYYGDKHVLGVINGRDDGVAVVQNVRGEQGSPYGGAGNQTVFVTYADNPRRMLVSWVGCVCQTNYGLIGSTAGQALPDRADVHYSHNAGGAGQYDEILLKRCDLGRNRVGGAGLEASRGVTITDSTLGLFAGHRIQGDRCLLLGPGIPFGDDPESIVRLTNSVLRPPYIEFFNYRVQGTITIANCTVDARAESRAGYNFPLCLCRRAGPLNLTWRNNVFLGPANLATAILNGATSADTLVFDHNLYQTGPGGFVLGDYNDGTTTADRTLTQWQALALGNDAGSLSADPRLAPDNSLLPDSPAIDLGADLGPQADFTGATFTVRNDAGAFEYPLPAFRQRPVGGTFTEGASNTLAATLAGNGPFTYQWQRDGQPIPGATGASLTLGNLLPGDSGQYVLLAANVRGTVASPPVTLLVHALNFSQWQTARFTADELNDPARSGPDADPDGDGIPNRLEHALGLDPHLADARLAPTASLENAADGLPHLTLTYRRLINAVGLTYGVEVSDDLVTWDPSGAQTELAGSPLPTGDRRTELIRVRLKAPVTDPASRRKFLRLRLN